MMSLKMRCSMVPLARLTTIRRDSSRFSAGYLASISGENSYPYCDNFILNAFLRVGTKDRLIPIRGKAILFQYLQFFEKFLQVPGVFEGEASAAGPAQRREVRAALQRLADFAGQRADVGSCCTARGCACAGGRTPRCSFVDRDERLAQPVVSPARASS